MFLKFDFIMQNNFLLKLFLYHFVFYHCSVYKCQISVTAIFHYASCQSIQYVRNQKISHDMSSLTADKSVWMVKLLFNIG